MSEMGHKWRKRATNGYGQSLKATLAMLILCILRFLLIKPHRFYLYPSYAFTHVVTRELAISTHLANFQLDYIIQAPGLEV
jgi:hypothetical protein